MGKSDQCQGCGHIFRVEDLDRIQITDRLGTMSFLDFCEACQLALKLDPEKAEPVYPLLLRIIKLSIKFKGQDSASSS